MFVTYDGSVKASGVKIYINGEPQETDVHADGLKQTIRTQVPLKVGQRHTGSRIDQLMVHTLRIYDRALSSREAGILAGATRAAALATSASRQAAAQRARRSSSPGGAA